MSNEETIEPQIKPKTEPKKNLDEEILDFESSRSEFMTELKKMVSNKFKDTSTIAKFFQILSDAGLETLEDWNKVTKEDKKKYPDGLKYLLDEKSGIEQENVGVLKRKREEDFLRQKIQKYEKNWCRNGTVVKDQSYFYVERTNLIKEFCSKLNKPNEMVFYVYCGPRASGKSSFTKTLLPPENGINILFEFYNFNSKHHC
jgi:hypothetical protein